MLTIIYSLISQPNKLGHSRASRWFELKVKLGCVWDVLQARYFPTRKQGSQPELGDGVTARYTPEIFGKLQS